MRDAPNLEFVLQPETLVGIRHVRELGTHGSAVHLVQCLQNFAQGCALGDTRGAAAGVKHRAEIGV